MTSVGTGPARGKWSQGDAMTDDTRDNGTLESAESDAAMEAAEEAAGASSGSTADAGPKIRRPRARTSGAGKNQAVAEEGIADTATGNAPATFEAPIPALPGLVEATELTVVRGRVGEATARTVDVRQGAIGRVEAEEVFVSQGAIGGARGERVSVELGGIGGALAGELRVTQGGAGTVIARTATIEQSLVRTLIAGEVRAERPIGVLVLLAGRVSGDVRPVLEWRGALAFGAVVGVVMALLRRPWRRG